MLLRIYILVEFVLLWVFFTAAAGWSEPVCAAALQSGPTTQLRHAATLQTGFYSGPAGRNQLESDDRWMINGIDRDWNTVDDPQQEMTPFSIGVPEVQDLNGSSFPLLSETPTSSSSARPPIAPFSLSSDWVVAPDSGLVSTNASATVPLLFGTTPPPLIRVGFTHTDLSAADKFAIPEQLFEYSIGLSWMRKWNDRWVIRTMLGVNMATDNENQTSDAWQFRGGVFGIYKQTENLSWTVGALATGRQDLPVIPAVGAVWNPDPTVRFDLTFPKPRVNFLVYENGPRQQWLYLGGGINGTTWGYHSPIRGNDRLTYRDFRLVTGWESRPTASSRTPFAIGRTLQAEIGYAFARSFEFDNENRTEDLNGSFTASISTQF